MVLSFDKARKTTRN